MNSEPVSKDSDRKPSRLETLLAETPWDRIVHFYGRASDFPEQVRLILSGEAGLSVYDEISRNIEHQDGVCQASPFMTEALIELLREDGTHHAAVLAILKRVYDAVRFQLTAFPAPDEPELGLEDELWPPFISEEEDEMLWEEWDSANWPYWQRRCHTLVCSETTRSILERESSRWSAKAREAARSLLEGI